MVRLASEQTTATTPLHPRFETNLSAPAHESILLMRSTWKGCTRTRMWNESLPETLEMYLFAQIRPASRASDEICWYSSERRCTQRGNSSTPAFFRPGWKLTVRPRGPGEHRLNGRRPKRRTQVEDTNLRVRDTTAEPRFRVGLVLYVSIRAIQQVRERNVKIIDIRCHSPREPMRIAK